MRKREMGGKGLNKNEQAVWGNGRWKREFQEIKSAGNREGGLKGIM